MVLSALVPAGLTGQEPPDTTIPPGRINPDSLRADTLAVADSLMVAPDTVTAIDTFPAFPRAHDSGWEEGVWEWSREDLLSNRALTLTELVMQIPGVIGLRGGDYGTPSSVVAFGAATRIRVYLDGFELVPLEGTVTDLSRIAIRALASVRVYRTGSELRVELETLQPMEVDPVTVIDIGTGDLGTNVLRATFAHPNTLGGALTFSLDRLETRGPALEEGGTLSGVGLRYAMPVGTKGGLVGELRSFSAASDLTEYPPSTGRTDWNVRGRYQLSPSVTVDGFWGASSFTSDDANGELLYDYGRSQAGLRLGLTGGPVWATASAGRFGGGGEGGLGLPDWTFGARAGVELEGRLTAEIGATRDEWDAGSATDLSARLATTSYKGFRAFGSVSDGDRGLPFVGGAEAYDRALLARDSIQAVVDTFTGANPPVVPDEPVLPDFRMLNRRAYRVGGSFEWRGFSAAGAYLSVEADSLAPTGLVLDAEGPVLPGGTRTGYEVSVGIPIWRGFRFDAAYQDWEEDWAYMPARTWDGEISYHGIFKESRNLEVRGAVGVMGRDPMSLRLIDPAPEVGVPEGTVPLLPVPFHQEWYGFIQVRVVTVSIFLRWENLTGKRNNEDFPGRAQPRFRTLYGVRWTLNN